MNNTLKTLVFGSLYVVASSAFATPIDYVDLRDSGININDGKITVSTANGNYANVSSGNNVDFHTEIKAGCNGLNNLKHVEVYAGNVNMQGSLVEAEPDLYSKVVPHGNQKSIGYTEALLNIPVGKLGFNPVQACNEMLQTKMNQGLSRNEIMSVDQTVILPYILSGVAVCGSENYHGTNHLNKQISITCKASTPKPAIPMGGNGNIQAKEMVIPAVPMGGNGTIQAGYQPLIITEASLLADTLSYTGSCPKELKFTVRIKGQGRGGVKYAVKDGMTYVKGGSNLTFDEKGTWWQDNFTYIVKLDQQKINQFVNHNFSLKVEYRDGQAQGLEWKNFNGTGLAWKHKCTPQTKFQMGNQQGGIKFNNQQPTPSMNIKAQPLQPDPKPKMNLKVQPINPEPNDQPKRAQ